MIYELDSISNIRELGGIITSTGKKVKTDLIFRSGDLSKINEQDKDFLKAKKIKAVIDFRDLSETKIHKDIALDGINYHSFPALPPLNIPTDPAERKAFIAEWNKRPLEVFKEIYICLAESKEAEEAYKNFFKVILSLDGQAFLYHCTQGKDRTGVASILLLSALGVSREEALKDYFLTNQVLKKDYDELVNSGAPKEKIDIMRIVLFVWEECINIYLGKIEKKYDSIYNYLKAGLKLTEEDINKLRENYLE